MSERIQFPIFGDKYNGQIMRQFISDIEKRFFSINIKQSRQQIINTASGSASASADIMYVDSTPTATGGVSINLGSASLYANRKLTVKDRGGLAGTNNITINASGSDKIDGSSSYSMTTNYQAVNLISDGANWNII